MGKAGRLSGFRVVFLILTGVLLVTARALGNIPFPEPAAGPDFVIAEIRIRGNTVTRNYIIKRELLLAENDTLSSSELAHRMTASQENLLNTSLFNFAEITADSVAGSPGRAVITVSVLERWFIWPAPVFELADRNFNTWLEKKDFTRVNYGFYTVWNNFTGNMDNLALLLRSGRNHRYSLLYLYPYVNRKKTVGFGFEVSFNRDHEVPLMTVSDKLSFIQSDRFLTKGYFFSLNVVIRPDIKTTHYAAIQLNRMAFDSLLLAENPSYTVNYRKKLVFPSFYYKLKLDHRDIRYYPLHGWYADAEFYKAGFTNSGRGDAEFTWIKSTGRVFTQWKQRWYAGAGLTVRQNFGDIPYYYRQGLGYDRDFVRGYEYYVVDGKGYAVVRTTVKFAVVPHRVSRISRIPWEKFSKIHYAAYLTCFADAGKTWGDFYEGSDGNAIPGKWIAGTGLGLDLVTYYDKVVRIEYSVNRSGESGIFIHLIAGI